ncbi:winged helix-turn-helix transcriptional regulator [Armatimonas rosea]|uniref:DNA-binding HxlR family transcriptional regulator n=1 Tax=Armatimonas rosea TaxID=685828 RepID=A0A7W9WA96_ARMRO|nr:helix-turn-helix domain-containing protein [Armatimonas rosea]MBB6054091.1 DNA-binding HxlR family transcriptional regulator [Armatimonas rosea]
MKKNKPSPSCPEGYRSTCPIANVLDILGDKWTLLVVRDLLLSGMHRYSEFQSSPEAIPTNILAERLKRLEAAGLVKKEFYQDNPPRAEYFITRKGADLGLVLQALGEWGHKYIPGVILPKEFIEPEIRD